MPDEASRVNVAEPLRREARVTALLLLWAVLLHLLFFASAGALWRDEANSAHQAQLGSWAEVWDSLRYDSFPLLFPALLRIWSSGAWTASDPGLRFFGFIAGLALLASIWAVARLSGSRRPVMALALVAVNPLLVMEGDSIRPYGVSLLSMAWVFGAFARSVATGSVAWLVLAAVFSCLAVQSSYSNAALIAALTLSALVVEFRCATRRLGWKLLLPGVAAAVSLIPYGGVLRGIAEWAPILRQQVDWFEFYRRHLDWNSAAYLAVWIGLLGLAVGSARRAAAVANDEHKLLLLFCGTAAAATLVTQIAVLELQRVPPFPRYFLPAFIPAAISIDTLTRGLRYRAIVAVTAVLLIAAPSWQVLRRQRSNADQIGEILTASARERDLVVVSPWFLHTSFQRYYGGAADWVTVPVLEPRRMMQYALVRQAMADPTREEALAGFLEQTFARGGDVWYVTQRRFRSDPGARVPRRPELSRVPGGLDYARFRSFWEEGIEYRLRSCCTGVEQQVDASRAVWEEEDLILIRWRRLSR
jgi:hypothetical protein